MSAAPDLALEPDAVDLWWVALDEVPDRALDVVTGDEITRGQRFRCELHRRRWFAARTALRQVLARYLGIAPAAVRFHYGPWGKPELAATGDHLTDQIRFNLAHAAERALIAVAREREVGVDLEWIDPALDVPSLLSVACTPAESARLAAAPEDRRVADFLTLWTLKEAYLKATGQGLSREPRSIEIERDAGDQFMIRDPEWNDPRASWCLQSLTNHDGWIGALAVAGSRVVVTERAFTVEAR